MERPEKNLVARKGSHSMANALLIDQVKGQSRENIVVQEIFQHLALAKEEDD